MEEIKGIISRTEKEIEDLDKEDPKYREMYQEKYLQARRDAGLPDDDNSFIKYMAQDVVFQE